MPAFDNIGDTRSPDSPLDADRPGPPILELIKRRVSVTDDAESRIGHRQCF